MGKKDRNRLQPKKNNHVPTEDLISREIAHSKEQDPTGRKRNPNSSQH